MPPSCWAASSGHCIQNTSPAVLLIFLFQSFGLRYQVCDCVCYLLNTQVDYYFHSVTINLCPSTSNFSFCTFSFIPVLHPLLLFFSFNPGHRFLVVSYCLGFQRKEGSIISLLCCFSQQRMSVMNVSSCHLRYSTLPVFLLMCRKGFGLQCTLHDLLLQWVYDMSFDGLGENWMVVYISQKYRAVCCYFKLIHAVSDPSTGK